MFNIVIPSKDTFKAVSHSLSSLPTTFTGEVYLIDSRSNNIYESDLITEYCLAKGYNYLNFDWNGNYPRKRNWFIELGIAKYDWTLFVDVDERLSDANIGEIMSFLSSPFLDDFSHGEFTFRNIYRGKELTYGVKMRKTNFCSMKYAKYQQLETSTGLTQLDMEIHEQLVGTKKLHSFKSEIDHYEFQSLYHYIQKHNEYSNWEAYVQYSLLGTASRRQKYKRFLIRIGMMPMAYLLVDLIWFRGLLNGRLGVRFALLKAIYFYLVTEKLKDLTDEELPPI